MALDDKKLAEYEEYLGAVLSLISVGALLYAIPVFLDNSDYYKLIVTVMLALLSFRYYHYASKYKKQLDYTEWANKEHHRLTTELYTKKNKTEGGK